MARTVIDVERLFCDTNFKIDDDVFFKIKLTNFIKKHGQFEEIIVANVDSVFKVVDGALMLSILKTLKWHTVNIYNLGEMTEKEYLTTRLFLSARQTRLNYLGIAEAVKEICSTERECQMLASRTSISSNDVKRFKELLTFDWEEFSRKPLSNIQSDLFS